MSVSTCPASMVADVPRRAARASWLPLLCLAGCAAMAAVTIAPASAQETVKIGEIEAQTGPLNTYGWMSSQGMRMAVDEINKAGGFEVAGKTYKLQLINP